MNQQEIELKMEAAKGDQYKVVFDSYVGPFIEDAKKVLFQAFQETPVSDVETLKDIKMQSTAINALEGYFMRFIESGKLAKTQLENES